jgi:hypothetical protein
MVIDYHYGFGKRGLLGAILELVDRPPYHYVTLAIIAFATFALAIALLVVGAWRDLWRDTGFAAAFLLFFLSAGFASLMCDVGRGEHFGFLLAAICLLMPVSLRWLALRAALMVSAALIQEANFLIFVPVLAVDVWAGRVASEAKWPFASALATALPAALMTFYLGNVRTACDGDAAMAQFQHLARDFHIQAIPIATLCLSGSQNLDLAMRALWAVGRYALIMPLALLVSIPSTAFNIWLAARVMGGRRLMVALGGAATLSPLLLLLVAVDVVRFVTLIQLTSLLLLIAAGRRFGPMPGGALPPLLRNGVALAMLAAFQLGTGVTLNDGYPMEKFPFQPLVTRLEEIINGHAPFLVIPPI